MQKYNPEIHEPRTGWDAIGIDMRIKEGHKLFVDKNGEVWTADRKIFAGKIRKEEPVLKIIKKNRKLRKENEELQMENAELRKAMEEALRDLMDADLTNKSIVIMSASILLEKALKKDPEERALSRIQRQ